MDFSLYGLSPTTLIAKENAIRTIRNQLLASSDWTQLPDAVLNQTERTAWQDYRQSLRDIPQNFSDPNLVAFPERP